MRVGGVTVSSLPPSCQPCPGIGGWWSPSIAVSPVLTLPSQPVQIFRASRTSSCVAEWQGDCQPLLSPVPLSSPADNQIIVFTPSISCPPVCVSCLLVTPCLLTQPWPALHHQPSLPPVRLAGGPRCAALQACLALLSFRRQF